MIIKPTTSEEMQLLLWASMAIIRMVNGIVDAEQKGHIVGALRGGGRGLACVVAKKIETC